MDFSSQSFEFEHIVPISRGGTTTLDNIAFACGGCNRHKYAKMSVLDPVLQKMVAIYNPREQSWSEHFAWSDDYLQLIGLTAIGRATVSSLQLNRPGVVNLRKLMYLAGQHPSSE